MQILIDPTAGNPCTQHYGTSPGHPPYAHRARFLGSIAGSWHSIGHAVGTQAGDLVRWVSDVWWKHHIDSFGLEDTVQAMACYEQQVAALDTGLIHFMQGVAEGAEAELAQSPYAEASSHYHKVLNTNIFDAWSWRHPARLPWNQGTATDDGSGCSSFAAAGLGVDGQPAMISAHNRHCPFNPKCYQIAYVGQPTDGHAYWTITPGGAGAGCQIVNSRGVSIILNAGGNQHAEQNANAFGVPWFLLFLHVATRADTAEDAIEIITRGTPGYRMSTGRNSLLRTGTWNFLISDPNECAVIETTCDRYAIRRPGDLGEQGNYLVMTNHNTCDHSFDANNERTTIPMTQFGSETTSEGSTKRFWTLMWDLANQREPMDACMAQQLMQGHHQHTRDGQRIESVPGEGPLQYEGDVTCPHAGGHPEKWTHGSADAKVAVCSTEVDIHWTLGRPCEWQGPWDRVILGSEGA